MFALISFIIGIYAREHLVNLNSLFDKKLAKTGLMECDASDHLTNAEKSASNIVQILEESVDGTNLVEGLSDLIAKYKLRRRNATIVL